MTSSTTRENRHPARNQRAAQRHALPMGYCRVLVRRGDLGPVMPGHAYDLSLSGVRFELDGPLAEGTRVDVTLELPGARAATVTASGKIVRMHDIDDIPPIRMAVQFDSFASPRDRQDLAYYLHEGLRAVA